MALSNWDTLSFGSDGKSCGGELVGFHGRTVSIYKNWLYVRDPSACGEHSDFSDGVVASIESGDISIAGFTIDASRGCQNSVFVYAETIRYADEKKGVEQEVRRMAGIGSYGYSDPTSVMVEEAGINEDDWDYVSSSTVFAGEEHAELELIKKKPDESFERKEIRFPMEDRFKSQWVGVEQSTVDEFLMWLRGLRDPEFDTEFYEWIDTAVANGFSRINQGDMYFGETEETPVGECEEPILMKLITR